jgi:hypothetical protein
LPFPFLFLIRRKRGKTSPCFFLQGRKKMISGVAGENDDEGRSKVAEAREIL